MERMEVAESKWFRYPKDETLEIKVRFITGPELDRARRDCRPVNAFDRMEIDQTAFIAWVSEKVILDWRGYTSGGKEIPFTVSECIELLSKQAPVGAWALRVVSDMEKFRGEGVPVGETNS